MSNTRRIILDWKKLFAFEQVEIRPPASRAQGMARLGERIGGKDGVKAEGMGRLGERIGGKVGVKDGASKIELSHIELVGETFDEDLDDDEAPAQSEDVEST